MKYVFNHFYKLRHDRYRTILMASSFNNLNVDVDVEWVSIIHPIYAMILSFFSRPITLDIAVYRIKTFLSIDENHAQDLVCKLVCNRDRFYIKYKGFISNFPKNLIIEESGLNQKIKDYNPTMFKYDKIDCNSIRLFEAPLDITFMLNNVCVTNCIYCYANKTHKCTMMDFNYIKEIIREAYNLKIKNIIVDGGEFFIYPFWREFLKELKSYDYVPNLVSTKYSLTENEIKDFSVYNIPLQISIDSFNSDILTKMVGYIPNYAGRMLDSLRAVDEVQSFQIATILTRHNGSIENLEDMLEHIKKFKRIKQWEIRVAFKSLYTHQDFRDIQLERSCIDKIQEWVEKTKSEVPFELSFSRGRENNFFKSKNGSKDFIGSRCSANSIHMFVLPDGQVSICEQLYWNKDFLIGDLKKQSIKEIWNSPRALFLANMSRKDYSEGSVCKKCELFETCSSYMNRCYTNILKVYGEDHWDYPDPRCYYAPRDISDSIYV